MERLMASATVTVELLQELVELGFTDEFFDIIHHFEGETINTYLKYCINHSSQFQKGGTNEKLQERLFMVLNSYKGGAFTNTEVFRFLAHASVKELAYK